MFVNGRNSLTASVFRFLLVEGPLHTLYLRLPIALPLSNVSANCKSQDRQRKHCIKQEVSRSVKSKCVLVR